jgi:tetratricopeptide (TPR) repeat protein
LKDGSTVKGHATAYDGSTKVLTVRTDDGRDQTIQLGELDTQSAYRVMRSTSPKDDAKAQIQLGNCARDARLYSRALQHYGSAEQIDPSSKAEIAEQRAMLRRNAAQFALENARDAIRRDNLREAKKWLTKIIEKLPEEPQADEAAKLMDDLLMRDPLKLDLPIAFNAPSALDSDLAPSKSYYDEMLQKTRAGLTSRRGGTFTTDYWQSALLDGEKGLRDIEQLEKKYTDAPSRELLAGYSKLFIAEIVALHLHLASVWTTRSSYHKAASEVNDALALDPRNEDALAARAHIEQAAKSGLGWWY